MRIFTFLRRCFSTNDDVLKKAANNLDKRVSVLSRSEEKYNIPKDVPKGHFAVYVGEERKRFVIKITSLKHPLFQELLDHVEEAFQFSNGSKLWIPCEECVFVNVLQCIGSDQRPWSSLLSMRKVIEEKFLSKEYKLRYCT